MTTDFRDRAAEQFATIADPGVFGCWHVVVEAAGQRWLTPDSIGELIGALETGRGVGVEEYGMDVTGPDTIEAAFISERYTRPRLPMVSELRRLSGMPIAADIALHHRGARGSLHPRAPPPALNPAALGFGSGPSSDGARGLKRLGPSPPSASGSPFHLRQRVTLPPPAAAPLRLGIPSCPRRTSLDFSRSTISHSSTNPAHPLQPTRRPYFVLETTGSRSRGGAGALGQRVETLRLLRRRRGPPFHRRLHPLQPRRQCRRHRGSGPAC